MPKCWDETTEVAGSGRSHDNCVFCVEYAIIRLKLELRQNRVSEIGSEWRESLNGIANEKLNPNESDDLKPMACMSCSLCPVIPMRGGLNKSLRVLKFCQMCEKKP